MRRALLAALLVACGGAEVRPTPAQQAVVRELLVPEAECRAPGPSTVSRAEALADLERLEQLFARGYAGHGDVPAARWAQAAAEVRADLPAELSPLALRDRIVGAYRFLADNHVGLWVFAGERDWESTGTHLRPFAGPPLERSAGGWLLDGEPYGGTVDARPFWTPEGLAWRPVILASEAPDAEVPFEPLAPQSLPPGPAFEREGGHLVLRSLMTPDADALERFVAAATPLRDEPVVTMDMHGTGGGADRYLVRFFARFAGRRLSYWTTGTLTSEATLQGAANFWGCIRAARGDAGEAGRAWLDERIARAHRELDEAALRAPFRDLERQPRHVPRRVAEPFGGRLIVATGPGCASACETTVLLARQLPGTWIVGHNTSGTMKVGELRWYRLERSRIWLALGRRAHESPIGGFEEERGFLPDLWVDGPLGPALESLEACARDAECAARVEAAIAATPGAPTRRR